MTSLYAYVITVFISTVFTVIVHALTERHIATKPYLILTAGLISVLIVLQPFLSVVQELSNGFQISISPTTEYSYETSEDLILEKSEEALNASITEDLCARFQISEVTVKTELIFDKKRDKFLVEEITVIVTDERIGESIRKYLTKEFSTAVLIQLKGDEFDETNRYQ